VEPITNPALLVTAEMASPTAYVVVFSGRVIALRKNRVLKLM
jgi:hypothetical protein